MSIDFKISLDAVATLLAAFIALVVYWLHKKDEKKKAAIILLSEIKEAERSIKEIQRSGGVSDFTSVLSENHWNEYQYLFATTLDSDEIDLVSAFYRSCTTIEEQITLSKNYLPIAMEQKARLSQDKIIELADRATNKAEFLSEKKRILEEAYWPDEVHFEPYTPKKKLISYISTVEFVISSGAGEKLKSIAKASWWKIFI